MLTAKMLKWKIRIFINTSRYLCRYACLYTSTLEPKEPCGKLYIDLFGVVKIHLNFGVRWEAVFLCFASLDK